ncbi:hypothetical protein FDP25_01370 [Roseovarius sp. A21]|uniref:Uncharacterized protein n=1 Tax=Roseovarius bejariae TaxID=2576383 RepID=A0A844CFP5_9RHOB|nr:hypothetical protein [Roseovarius bejariae]MRU14071.1 hypothetical protein [Roseovarius bejariae]
MSNASDDKDHPVLKAFKEIEKPLVNEEDIAEFTDEDDFNRLGVSLLIEAGCYVCIAANTLGVHEKWIETRPQ